MAKNKTELLAEAAELGLELDPGMSNKAMAKAIEDELARREEAAEGEGGETPSDREDAATSPAGGGGGDEAGDATPDEPGPAPDPEPEPTPAPEARDPEPATPAPHDLGAAVDDAVGVAERAREDTVARLYGLARAVGEGSLTESECAGEVAALLPAAQFDKGEWPAMVRLAQRRAELRQHADADADRLGELVASAEEALVRTRSEADAAIEAAKAKVKDAADAVVAAKADVERVASARAELIGCAPAYLRDQLKAVRDEQARINRDLPNAEQTADYWANEVRLRGQLEAGASGETGNGKRLRERTAEARRELARAEAKLRDMRGQRERLEESVAAIREEMVRA